MAKKQPKKTDRFDVSLVPAEGRLVDIKAVVQITSLSERTIERLVLEGTFPKPLKIYAARRWRLSDVCGWVKSVED